MGLMLRAVVDGGKEMEVIDSDASEDIADIFDDLRRHIALPR
jgi:hypothetical protein